MVSISKLSEDIYRINFGKYCANLVHVTDEETNSDLWNLLGIYCGETAVVSTGTDIIGPIRELGQPDFMGGLHGDEKNKVLFITCDGIRWDEMTETEGDTVQIVMNSELYRVSSKEHVYNRFITITFTENRIHIVNRHECLVGDSVISSAPTGGLIAVQHTILTAISMPNYFTDTPPCEPVNNRSTDNISGTLYWTGGSIEVRNIFGKGKDTYEGNLCVYTKEVPMRSKIYLYTIKPTKAGTPIKKGETILGEFEYLFR